jgi:hypothetical protein
MNAAPSNASRTAALPTSADWSPARSGTQRVLAGFLQVLDIEAEQAERHPDAMTQLRRGELQAIVVHGVYAEPDMAAAVERLHRHDPPFLQTWFPEVFRAWFYGRNINLADADLAGYFDEAATFNAQLATLLAQGPDLASRVSTLLSTLDGGRPHTAAPGPLLDQRYMFTTLRAHVEQGYIPAHFDNEMWLRPSYRHLASLVDEHITSFVLTLSPGDSGGELEVFDLCCPIRHAQLLSDDRVPRPALDGLASVRFRLPPGAMIVLDSGRYLHRVTRVVGQRTRWTACSFMARSRGGDVVHCWG